MTSAIFLYLFLTAFSFWLSQVLHERYPETNVKVFRSLVIFHTFLSFVYYLYALFNRSDSQFYYYKVASESKGPSWFDYYGVSTTFVEFVGYPFITYFSFSYEAMMILFAWFGVMGFFY